MVVADRLTSWQLVGDKPSFFDNISQPESFITGSASGPEESPSGGLLHPGDRVQRTRGLHFSIPIITRTGMSAFAPPPISYQQKEWISCIEDVIDNSADRRYRLDLLDLVIDNRSETPFRVPAKLFSVLGIYAKSLRGDLPYSRGDRSN